MVVTSEKPQALEVFWGCSVHPVNRGPGQVDFCFNDGSAKGDVRGKAESAATITTNTHKLFAQCGVSTTFLEQVSETDVRFGQYAPLPYKWVVRRPTSGSLLELQVCCYATGDWWSTSKIQEKNPRVMFNLAHETAWLFHPSQPFEPRCPTTTVQVKPHDNEPLPMLRRDSIRPPGRWQKVAEEKVRFAFLVMEKQWALRGRTLAEMTFQLGIDESGKIVVAGPIDDDSWEFSQMEKKSACNQNLGVAGNRHYQTARQTESFGIPTQEVVTVSYERSKELEDFVNHLDFWGITVQTIDGYGIDTDDLTQKVASGLSVGANQVIIVYGRYSFECAEQLSDLVAAPVLKVSAYYEQPTSYDQPSPMPVWSKLDVAGREAFKILANSNPSLYPALCDLMGEPPPRRHFGTIIEKR
jgi:phosphoribosylaminoimidazole-succinocarboxamide synthase